MTDRKRARGRSSGRAPLSRSEFEQGIAALVNMHARRELSSQGLIDALLVLSDAYAADVQAARRADLRREGWFTRANQS